MVKGENYEMKYDDYKQKKYEKIELFSEPREIIIPRINAPRNEPEMTCFESSFLSGLLKRFRPKNILEVGLAAGGTSAIIMQCMKMLDESYEMYSVDLQKQFYVDNRFESGYLAETAKQFLPDAKQKRLLGKLAFEQMPEIGSEIDFLILDTVHRLPGEILDFLSLLPYLKNGAVVVLHDICCNVLSKNIMWVTKLLMCTVTAEKNICKEIMDAR